MKPRLIAGLMLLILMGITGGIVVAKADQIAGQPNQAVIIVDPGFSKFSLKVAGCIAIKLMQKGYLVETITVNQFKNQVTGEVKLLVIGGPTYMREPSGRLKKVVKSLNNGGQLKTLLFITGRDDCAGLEPLEQQVKAKGFNVIGGCKVLDTIKDEAGIAAKVDQLLAQL